MQLVNGTSSVVVEPDSTYRFVTQTSFVAPAHHIWYAVNSSGDTISTSVFISNNYKITGGLAHSLELTADGKMWYAGSTDPFNGDESDGLLICYESTGDTCWTRTYGDEELQGFNGLCLTQDGGALLVGIHHLDVYVVRVDQIGDTLWTNTYGAPVLGESGVSVRNTIDGGFIISGLRQQLGNDNDAYILKLDSLGQQLWSRVHGTPFSDGVGFVEQMEDGNYILAGSTRAHPDSAIQATLFFLNSNGQEVWSQDDYTDIGRSTFYSVPVITQEKNFVIAGSRLIDGLNHGMLMSVDSLGEQNWTRTYSISGTYHHFFYDVRRTLDGGYIMAGTAFDSLDISQDAWLVKVDSFGCLVAGCQIFDGLEEQFTDLIAALTLAPNPANESTILNFELPDNFQVNGPIELSLMSIDGRLVHHKQMPDQLSISHTLDLSGISSGVYFVHLRDGNRWLAGKKLVVQ